MYLNIIRPTTTQVSKAYYEDPGFLDCDSATVCRWASCSRYCEVSLAACMYVAYVRMYVCVRVCITVCMRVCTIICVHVCMYVCVYVYVYEFMYVYACDCMYVCVCMHTYTHTHARGIILSSDSALQGRRHHRSLCSNDVVRSRASMVAVNYTLCVCVPVRACVRVISDFSGQTVAEECSVKTSLHSQSYIIFVYYPKCCG